MRAQDVAGIRALVTSWPVATGVAVTTPELIEYAGTDGGWRRAVLAWCPSGRPDALPSARSLGCVLRAVRGRAIEGYMLLTIKRGNSGAVWVRVPSHTP
jgi:hypothetical protein